MADQVAVLRDGVIGQVDTPSALYGLPRDAGLAQFLGEANLLEGTVSGQLVTTALGTSERGLMAWVGQRVVAPARRPGSWCGPSRSCSVPMRATACPAWCAATSTSATTPWSGSSPAPGVGLPELVVRITGGQPWTPGSRVGLKVHGCRGGVAAGRKSPVDA